MIRFVATTLCLLFCAGRMMAQDTLPDFTVVAKPNNRNVISWTNTFPFVSQIIIQRSYDSLRNFKTILNVPDPSVPQNGFVDAKAPAGRNFYRLFIVLENGKYQFSRSRQPERDMTPVFNEPVASNENPRVSVPDASAGPKFFIIKRRGLIIDKVYARTLDRYRDSIANKTRDTLVFQDVDTLVLKPFVAHEAYRASRWVYTEKYGNVMINLPDAQKKNYTVQFFTENKSPLFEIKEIGSDSLVVDKTNFIRSGWFWFELYEDGKLKERNKFFIPKDF